MNILTTHIIDPTPAQLLNKTDYSLWYQLRVRLGMMLLPEKAKEYLEMKTSVEHNQGLANHYRKECEKLSAVLVSHKIKI